MQTRILVNANHESRVNSSAPFFLKVCITLPDIGRQLRAGKRGMIPDQIAPILERLGVIGEGWVETVRQFGRRFKTAAGRSESLAALAVRRGEAWLQGHGAAALALR